MTLSYAHGSVVSATDSLTDIDAARYWHRSFPRASVTLWNARTGVDTVDGVTSVYVSADRSTVTLVGREPAVRFGKGTKVVSIVDNASGAPVWVHPADTASGVVNGSIAANLR